MNNEPTNPVYKYLNEQEVDRLMLNIIKEKHKWDEGMLVVRHCAIFDLLRKGYSKNEIQEDIHARWGVDPSVAYKYLREALQYMTKDNEEFGKYARDIQIERLENIAKESKASGKYKEAVMALAELNKIYGLNKETVTVEVDRVFKFGGEESK